MCDLQITTYHALSQASHCDVPSVFPQFHDTREPRVNINSLPKIRLTRCIPARSLPTHPFRGTRPTLDDTTNQHDESCPLRVLSTDLPYNFRINSCPIPPAFDKLTSFVSPRSSAARCCSLAKLTTQPRANPQILHFQSPHLLSSEQRDTPSQGRFSHDAIRPGTCRGRVICHNSIVMHQW
jgi:hypothetical protein